MFFFMSIIVMPFNKFSSIHPIVKYILIQVRKSYYKKKNKLQ